MLKIQILTRRPKIIGYVCSVLVHVHKSCHICKNSRIQYQNQGAITRDMLPKMGAVL